MHLCWLWRWRGGTMVLKLVQNWVTWLTGHSLCWNGPKYISAFIMFYNQFLATRDIDWYLCTKVQQVGHVAGSHDIDSTNTGSNLAWAERDAWTFSTRGRLPTRDEGGDIWTIVLSCMLHIKSLVIAEKRTARTLRKSTLVSREKGPTYWHNWVGQHNTTDRHYICFIVWLWARARV